MGPLEIIAQSLIAHAHGLREAASGDPVGIVAALLAAGYKIVGREPSEAMVDAAMSFGWQPSPLNIGYDEAWRAMWDAA